MPWSKSDYPNAFKNLEPNVRAKAIDIANALLEAGKSEGTAIAIAIKTARDFFKNKSGMFRGPVPTRPTSKLASIRVAQDSENKQALLDAIVEMVGPRHPLYIDEVPEGPICEHCGGPCDPVRPSGLESYEYWGFSDQGPRASGGSSCCEAGLLQPEDCTNCELGWSFLHPFTDEQELQNHLSTLEGCTNHDEMVHAVECGLCKGKGYTTRPYSDG